MRPLLMIPGPIEVSPAVLAACAVPPPGHLSPAVMEAFAPALARMRDVWEAAPDSQPFVVAGSGTTAMEMAVVNLVEEGDAVVVVSTGYFSDRMAEMLRRRGARVRIVEAEVGHVPGLNAVRGALEQLRQVRTPARVLFATHVDTSTGVRIDPEPLARVAREQGALSVFDGVCATGAERFEMENWDADVYLTASQKAIGLPPGLGLLVASAKALARRAELRTPPPMSLDWNEWRPVMEAYGERRPAYFATPATNLVLGLDVALTEILDQGVEARVAAHTHAARALGAAWEALDLTPVPALPELRASTLSALHYPKGVDASLVAAVARHGVIIAGGLHPRIRASYFRVGHMGYAITQKEMLLRTVRAVEAGLRECGHRVSEGTAQAALEAALSA